ncbi:conserved membrane protein of unknown function [Nitrospira japonica]|uniref:Uncharacterized protein n=2 Tax=Nitrospira japonica TaxID=1325564 RepID=A0A1W1I2W3_9BACT|nr:conserved membrane protein of unknown function [Nitrospira japonica]
MGMMIYGLCALTSFLCAWLLLQAYARTAYKLLLWTGMFFVVSTVNNLLLMIDKIVFPVTIDLSIPRYLIAFLALGVLFRGLIFEEE